LVQLSEPQWELPKVCVVDNGACRTGWFSLTASTVYVWFYLVGGMMTKKAVQGTAKFTAGAMEGTVNAATNLGGGMRRRATKPKHEFDDEDFAQFDDDGYNDYYG
jgi:hypothetical protein